MTADDAEHYHREQIESLAATDADLVHAMTLTYADEAIGITRAAMRAQLPVVISFTTETDGRLPDGTSLGDAIDAVDSATNMGPAYYGINCSHPTHFGPAFPSDDDGGRRIRSIRANASSKSHAELDEAETLDIGDADDLAQRYRELRAAHPQLTVLGGCCGTDATHVEAMAGPVSSCRPCARRGINVGRGRRVRDLDLLETWIVNAVEQPFPAAKEHRPDVERDFVDHACGECLPDRRGAA